MVKQKRRAIVTGAGGFIGKALAKTLLFEGWHVLANDIEAGSMDGLQGGDLLKIEGKSFDDEQLLGWARSGIYDALFHQAAIPRVSYSVKHPVETTDTNVLKTLKLLEACREGGIKKIVFASSSSVYGDVHEDDLPLVEIMPRKPASPYALQKAFIEQYAEMAKQFYDQDIVCLRYFNVFGPGQLTGGAYSTVVPAWCEAIKEGKSLRLDGDGEQSRDFAYITDVVTANILAAESNTDLGGQILNIAGGNRISLNEILGWLRERFDVVVESAPTREGDIRHTAASLVRASKALGYRPQVEFFEGLERTIEWWGLNSKLQSR